MSPIHPARIRHVRAHLGPRINAIFCTTGKDNEVFLEVGELDIRGRQSVADDQLGDVSVAIDSLKNILQHQYHRKGAHSLEEVAGSARGAEYRTAPAAVPHSPPLALLKAL